MTDGELNRFCREMAADAAWSLVESCSTVETDRQMEWRNVSDDYLNGAIADAFKLLVALRLAEVHPQYPFWIRKIADL